MVTVAALAGEAAAPGSLRRAESALRTGAARPSVSTRTSRRTILARPPAPGVGPARSGRSTGLTGAHLRFVTIARAILAGLPSAVACPLDRTIAFVPVAAERQAHRQPAWPQ